MGGERSVLRVFSGEGRLLERIVLGMLRQLRLDFAIFTPQPRNAFQFAPPG